MDVLINNSDDTILFHEIAQPLTTLLTNPDYLPEHDSAKKMTFESFITLLLYFYFSGLDSLRSLITDLKTKDVSKIGLFAIGLTTIHDAFCRYQAGLLQQLYVALLKVVPPRLVEEFQEFGPIICADGSMFAIAISAIWAQYKTHANAVKLHLGFSLNEMLTSCFLVTAASYDERKALAQLIESGVTYIADRGYLSFDLFQQINDKPAYFIIRVRKRLHYEIERQLPVQLIAAVATLFFQVTDEIVRFNCDSKSRIYRRISFRTRQTRFILVTNRLDLTTFDIIRRYAFRWQIELFFRYFKRTLKALHLLNIHENGVTIQFYIVLIAHLLVLRYKQQQLQLCLFKNQELAKLSANHQFGATEDFIASLGKSIPQNFKIKKQEWNAIKNSLLKCVQLTFDFF
jgi:hypothetical protein